MNWTGRRWERIFCLTSLGRVHRSGDWALENRSLMVDAGGYAGGAVCHDVGISDSGLGLLKSSQPEKIEEVA